MPFILSNLLPLGCIIEWIIHKWSNQDISQDLVPMGYCVRYIGISFKSEENRFNLYFQSFSQFNSRWLNGKENLILPYKDSHHKLFRQMNEKPIVKEFKNNLFRVIIHIVEEELICTSERLISGGTEYLEMTSGLFKQLQDVGRKKAVFSQCKLITMSNLE